jgi:hypothetical protein
VPQAVLLLALERHLLLAVRAERAHQALRHDAEQVEFSRYAGAPRSSRRVIEVGASLVCSVESTRWPVSAAWIAMSAVS